MSVSQLFFPNCQSKLGKTVRYIAHAPTRYKQFYRLLRQMWRNYSVVHVSNSALDLDECSIDFVNTCDVNAQCYNVIGSFQCQCNFGYRGDGRQCTSKI